VAGKRGPYDFALGDWKVPITWRGELRELGNETELARHKGIAQELKM